MLHFEFESAGEFYQNEATQTTALIEAIEHLERFWAVPDTAHLKEFQTGRNKDIPSLGFLKTLLFNEAAGEINSARTISLLRAIERLESFWANPHTAFLKKCKAQMRIGKGSPNVVALKTILLEERKK